MTDYILLEADIDLSKWDKAVGKMMADARKMENLLTGLSVDIKVNVADNELKNIEGRLAGLDTSADLRLNVADDELTKAQAKINKLDSAENITLNVADTEITTAKKKIDGLDTSAEVDISVTGDDAALNRLEDIEGKLGDLQALARIQLALDATQFLSTFENLPIISNLVEIDSATQRVLGGVERDLPGIGAMIDRTYVNAWGDSKDEIADVYLALALLRDETGKFLVTGSELEDTVEGVFQTVAISGENQEMVIRAATALVKNEYVGSFREAFDFISKGFRQGAGGSEDLLESFEEYASRLTNAGLSAQAFFNIVQQGTAAGARNTDQVVDAFSELFDLTKEEVAIMGAVGDETDRTRALMELGLIDQSALFAQGELTGDQFGAAVIEALIARTSDPATQQRLAKAVFSPTMVENAGLENLLAIDLTREINYEGTAKEGADIINDTFETAATEFGRTLEQAIITALDNALGLRAMLERGKVAATAFADAIQAGESVGGALEVALQLPGLEHSLGLFQSALGNIAIGLLEAVASIGEFLGKDVSGIRTTIAGAAAGQLGFDIQLAGNADEVAASYRTAIARGLSDEKAQAEIQKAISNLLDAGDLEGAQKLVANLQGVIVSGIEGTVTGELSPYGRNIVDQVGGDLVKAREEIQKRLAQPIVPERGELNVDLWRLEEAQTAEALDITPFQSQISEFVTGITDELQAAISEGDFEKAMGLALESGLSGAVEFVTDKQQAGVTKAYADSMIGAMGEGMNIFNKDALMTGFDNASFASAFVADMHTQLNAAIGAGDVGETQRLAQLLGFDETTVDSLVLAATNRMLVLREDMDKTSQTAELTSQEMTGSFREIEKGSGSFDIAKTNFNALATAVISQSATIRSRLGDIVNILGLFDTAGQAALNTSASLGGGTGASAGFASGGVTEGASLVGEKGPELIFPNEKMAVLNNKTTDNIFRALSGMGGGVTNNRNSSVTVINNFNVANMAQAVGAGGRVADQVRGYT